MVYADISSLYENGEHYDSLYGGASPGNVTPVVPIGPGDPPRKTKTKTVPYPMKNLWFRYLKTQKTQKTKMI